MIFDLDYLKNLEIFKKFSKNKIACLLDFESMYRISYHMESTSLFDSYLFRCKFLASKVASVILNDDGEIIAKKIDELLDFFSKPISILLPFTEMDDFIFKHIQNCLKNLKSNEAVLRILYKFKAPLEQTNLQFLFRDFFLADDPIYLNTQKIRHAVLTAYLTKLRQKTGSCFATSVAIFIQENNPIQFFQDVFEIFSKGQLKRIIDQNQYSVAVVTKVVEDDFTKNTNQNAAWILSLLGFSFELHNNENTIIDSVDSIIKKALFQQLEISQKDVDREKDLELERAKKFWQSNTSIHFLTVSQKSQAVAKFQERYLFYKNKFLSLSDSLLLRAWEYTLASFCDVKVDFARWNLYISLGMHPSHEKGIASFLYYEMQLIFQNLKQNSQSLYEECIRHQNLLKSLEAMVLNAISENRINQLKNESFRIHSQLQYLLEKKIEQDRKLEKLSLFYADVIEQYDKLLQKEFQELFDPSIQDEKVKNLQNDSPAGFRLVYKHRRDDANCWSWIYEEKMFISSLIEFFTTTEKDIIVPKEFEKNFFSSILTLLIQHIQTPSFLDGCKKRAFENGRRSPWDYVSGGNLELLMKSYFSRSNFCSKVLEPKNPKDLLNNLFSLNSSSSLLMQSPTHAFIFHPNQMQKSQLKKSNIANFSFELQKLIVYKLASHLPQNLKETLIYQHSQKFFKENVDFRNFLLHIIQNKTIVDSILYEYSSNISEKQALDYFDIHIDTSNISAFDFIQLVKMKMLQKENPIVCNFDIDEEIINEMREKGLALQKPVFFADPNWSCWLFGFIQNPITDEVELWRLNRTGTKGYPMDDWDDSFFGPNNKDWKVFTNINEYLLV